MTPTNSLTLSFDADAATMAQLGVALDNLRNALGAGAPEVAGQPSQWRLQASDRLGIAAEETSVILSFRHGTGEIGEIVQQLQAAGVLAETATAAGGNELVQVRVGGALSAIVA